MSVLRAVIGRLPGQIQRLTIEGNRSRVDIHTDCYGPFRGMLRVLADSADFRRFLRKTARMSDSQRSVFRPLNGYD